VPDPDWRAFTLHFKPGSTGEQRRARACEVLGLAPEDLEDVCERQSVLPSPRRGHAELVRTIDRLLAPRALALTGNWFGGLAIEDCVSRSRAEWQRVAGLPAG
jgi:UDP-galactopyranose mutase